MNQLLYSLIYSNDIDDEMINFNGDSAVQYTTLELGPEVYFHAIEQALASGEPLDEKPLLPQFDQAQIANFLRGVLGRLDELRPWRDPKYRSLDFKTWEENFAYVAQIARLDASVVEVTRALQKGFGPVGETQPGLQACILWLQTGETVALLGYYGLDQKVILMTDASNDPAQVIDHFISATGFPAGKVIVIGSDDIRSDHWKA